MSLHLAVGKNSGSGIRSLARRIGTGPSKFGMVGARGFEPPTPASRTQCATGLRYAPTCEPTHEERDSVLQQDGGKRQAMRFGHSLTSHLAVVEIDSLRKTGVRTNSPLKPFRSQAEYEG